MPMYQYLIPETQETWDELWSYASHKQFLQDNPHIQQVFHAPMIVGGTGDRVKTDSGMNDVLGRIAAANPFSPLAEKYGSKGIKESKTREAVNKVKSKIGGALT